MTLPGGGLFMSGLTLSELLTLRPLAGASGRELLHLDDVDPIEKKAKARGMRIAWDGSSPLAIEEAPLLDLFGEDKWSLLELRLALPGGPVTLAGWENRYWKITGTAEPEVLVVPALERAFGLAGAPAAALSEFVREWIDPGVYLRLLPDGTIRAAAMLRARSRVYLGLEAQPFKEIRARDISPDGVSGPVGRLNQLAILPVTACLYDQLALGAALIFILLSLLCAGLATLAWKQAWPLTGVLFSVGFVLCALYGMRLAGARED